MVNKDFLKQILREEKKLLKMSDFEKCNTKTVHELARNHEGLYSVFSGGVGSARALVSEEAKKQ